MRQEEQQADVQVDDADPGRERHDRERQQHRHHDHGRREHEDRLVGERRNPVFLGEHLDRVGERSAAGRTGRRGSGRSGPATAPSSRRSTQISSAATPSTHDEDHDDDEPGLQQRIHRGSIGTLEPAPAHCDAPVGRGRWPAARPSARRADRPAGRRRRAAARRRAQRQPTAALSPAARCTCSPSAQAESRRHRPDSAPRRARAQRSAIAGDEHAQLLGAEDVVQRHDAATRRRAARRAAGLASKYGRPCGPPLPARSAARRDRRRAAGRPPRSGTCSPPESSSSPAPRSAGSAPTAAGRGSLPSRRPAPSRDRRRRLRLVDADVGEHRGASAVAVRLARDLLPRDAEAGRRRASRRSPASCGSRGGAARHVSRSSSALPGRCGLRVEPAGDAISSAEASASSPGSSPSGTNTWKKRCARPSLFTSVPSPSAKVAAGSTTSARSPVGVRDVVDDDDVRARGRGTASTARCVGAPVEVVLEDRRRCRPRRSAPRRMPLARLRAADQRDAQAVALGQRRSASSPGVRPRTAPTRRWPPLRSPPRCRSWCRRRTSGRSRRRQAPRRSCRRAPRSRPASPSTAGRRGIERMRDGEAEPRQVVGRGVPGARRDVVEPRRARRWR